MDGFVGAVAHAYHVFWVKQRIRVPQHVFLRQRVQVVDDDLRPDQLAIPYHPIRNLVPWMCQIAARVPHNDLVPELPPFSRLVKILVQIPIKSKGIHANGTMQLQIVEAPFKRRILAKLRVCLPAHPLSTPYTSRPWQMPCRSLKDRSVCHAGSQGLPLRYGKRTQM